jgi:hypothetical protein
MDTVQKHIYSDYHSPLSEPYGVYSKKTVRNSEVYYRVRARHCSLSPMTCTRLCAEGRQNFNSTTEHSKSMEMR